MEMISEQRIAATREKVWAALNNTEILKQSMPGCESFEAVGDNIFEAQITTKVGPVKAKFKFKVELADIKAPHGYTIKGEGQGGGGAVPHPGAATGGCDHSEQRRQAGATEEGEICRLMERHLQGGGVA